MQLPLGKRVAMTRFNGAFCLRFGAICVCSVSISAIVWCNFGFCWRSGMILLNNMVLEECEQIFRSESFVL